MIGDGNNSLKHGIAFHMDIIKEKQHFQTALISWFGWKKRSLPWRNAPDWYAVFL